MPQYVIDGNGRVFHLRFDNAGSDLMWLAGVELLDALPAFGTAPAPARFWCATNTATTVICSA